MTRIDLERLFGLSPSMPFRTPDVSGELFAEFIDKAARAICEENGFDVGSEMWETTFLALNDVLHDSFDSAVKDAVRALKRHHTYEQWKA